jgi:hypothetical protein
MMVVGALLAVAPLACRSGRTYQQSSGGDVVIASTVTIEVKNDNFADVNVYAIVEGGVARRLGTVTGNTAGKFSLRASEIPTGTVRLVADAIGGAGRASSGPLLVNGGGTIVFTIAPALAQSSATVR